MDDSQLEESRLESKYRYDTYCGLYCGACDALVATQEGRIDELAMSWESPPEDVVCYGCKTERVARCCNECLIRGCAINKKVEFCFQCDDYPCDLLVSFRDDRSPHHSIVLKNLREISENGVEIWLDSQRQRWSCPGCGKRFSWYDKFCSQCGSGLYNCEDEERDLELR
ncbi:MAG: DUF3795 domain-containing protein [bacterium]